MMFHLFLLATALAPAAADPFDWHRLLPPAAAPSGSAPESLRLLGEWGSHRLRCAVLAAEDGTVFCAAAGRPLGPAPGRLLRHSASEALVQPDGEGTRPFWLRRPDAARAP
jgi:hypothetical protein